MFQVEGPVKEEERCPWNSSRLLVTRKTRVSAEERRVRDGVYSSRTSDRSDKQQQYKVGSPVRVVVVEKRSWPSLKCCVTGLLRLMAGVC